ncbi:hypothetical protein [Marinomonas gallaica]|uniref:hypothetical protein n=1 Tax=Marinomonas gallaica TaxID=1806667 RepID=UPI003A8F54EB
MKLIPKPDFDLDPIDDQKSIIVDRNRRTQSKITGTALELCARYKDWFLIFTTDDTPFEDMLHVYLLDNNFNVLDSLTIGAMYSTGSLSDPQLISTNNIEFRFIGDTDWSITILDQAKFGILYFSSIKGVRRTWQCRHYLNVEGQPKPEIYE